jgi:hypothetical protein
MRPPAPRRAPSSVRSTAPAKIISRVRSKLAPKNHVIVTCFPVMFPCAPQNEICAEIVNGNTHVLCARVVVFMPLNTAVQFARAETKNSLSYRAYKFGQEQSGRTIQIQVQIQNILATEVKPARYGIVPRGCGRVRHLPVVRWQRDVPNALRASRGLRSVASAHHYAA